MDPDRIVALAGNLRPAMLRQNDEGRVDRDFPLPALTLFLNSSSTQKADLRQFLEQQQNPASPLYHHWLSPDEFADRFGLSQTDGTASCSIGCGLKGSPCVDSPNSRTWIRLQRHGPPGRRRHFTRKFAATASLATEIQLRQCELS